MSISFNPGARFRRMNLKREIQVEAFRKGLIPYIPADRPAKREDEDEESRC